jgi:hypothetical protein
MRAPTGRILHSQVTTTAAAAATSEELRGREGERAIPHSFSCRRRRTGRGKRRRRRRRGKRR